jgi:hypothetical protein
MNNIVTGNADDANIIVGNIPFQFYFNGVNYGNGQNGGVYIGANGYITFGSGSGAYNGLSVSNPPQPKILLFGSDNSYQKVYAGAINSGNAFVMRYEGNGSGSGTVNAPGIVWEVTFYKNQKIQIVIDITNRPTGICGIASTNAYIDNMAGAAYAAKTSYAVSDNGGDHGTGLGWTVATGSITYGYPIPSPTPTPTISVTPSITPTITVSASVTPTISVTPSITPTTTITPTISVTPTITPTISITPSVTLSVSVTPSNGTSPTPTISITPTGTPLATGTPVVTPTISITPTISVTPSITPTITVTSSITPTVSLTPSVTVSPTVSNTPTVSITPTITTSITITPSVTPTISITPSNGTSPTPTLTVTPTPSPMSFTATVQSLSPYAYFRLNDLTSTAVDSSNLGQNATWSSGTGSYTQGQTSILPHGTGAATAKTGNSRAAATFTLGARPTGVWSIIAMVNPSSFPGAANVILCMGSGAQQFGFNNTGNLVAGSSGVSNYTASTGTVTAGTSHLVGVSMNGSTGTYYIDGVAAGTITGAGAAGVCSSGYIGAFSDGSSYPFVGTLQEIAFFPTALTAAQMATLWSVA